MDDSDQDELTLVLVSVYFYILLCYRQLLLLRQQRHRGCGSVRRRWWVSPVNRQREEQ